MKKNLFFVVPLVFGIIFSSCVTTNQTVIEKNQFDGELQDFELEFARLDGEMLLKKNAALVSEAEKLCSKIEFSLNDSGLSSSALARLYALEGSASLLAGKKAAAKLLYEKSDAAFKADVRAVILLSRLQSEDAEKLLSQAEHPLFKLETALNAYRENGFAKAVAFFDEAFVKLDPLYRTYYGAARENAWRLRSVSSTDDSLKLKNSLSVFEMVSLVKAETSLLDSYAFEKSVTDSQMYKKISDAGLLDCVSLPPDYSNSVSKNDSATKIICARFLWNIYCARKGFSPEAKSRYSSAFIAAGRESPVLDVKSDSPDFDAVLGCVEREILNLEDGVLFMPEKPVSAVELLESVKKIR